MSGIAAWIRANTPAASAIGAILTAWGGFLSGAGVTESQAIGATFSAFALLVIAYAHVDAAQVQAPTVVTPAKPVTPAAPVVAGQP